MTQRYYSHRNWIPIDNIREIARSGVEHDDARLSYLTVQMDRAIWNEIVRIVRDFDAYAVAGVAPQTHAGSVVPAAPPRPASADASTPSEAHGTSKEVMK